MRSFFAYQGYVGGVWLSTSDFTWTQQFTSADTPVNIPDNGALLPRSTIAVNPKTISDTTLTPKAIQIDLVIDPQTAADHANQDLDVFLQSPDGTQLKLFDDVDANGGGFTITVSDSTTAGTFPANASPAGSRLTGTFRPEDGGSLSGTFGNLPAAGNWMLLIRDDFVGDLYRLSSWTIRFVF